MDRIGLKEIERATRARAALEYGAAAVDDPQVLAQVRAKVIERLKLMGNEAEEPPATPRDHEPIFGDRIDWRKF